MCGALLFEQRFLLKSISFITLALRHAIKLMLWGHLKILWNQVFFHLLFASRKDHASILSILQVNGNYLRTGMFFSDFKSVKVSSWHMCILKSLQSCSTCVIMVPLYIGIMCQWLRISVNPYSTPNNILYSTITKDLFWKLGLGEMSLWLCFRNYLHIDNNLYWCCAK